METWHYYFIASGLGAFAIGYIIAYVADEWDSF